jgi:hypothetical protein
VGVIKKVGTKITIAKAMPSCEKYFLFFPEKFFYLGGAIRNFLYRKNFFENQISRRDFSS